MKLIKLKYAFNLTFDVYPSEILLDTIYLERQTIKPHNVNFYAF